MPKPFPAEFRRDVVAYARQSDQSIAAVARSFGISESCLSRWLQIADRQDTGMNTDKSTASKTDSAGTDLETENKELRRRATQLEQENQILRRATAYFARDVLPK